MSKTTLKMQTVATTYEIFAEGTAPALFSKEFRVEICTIPGLDNLDVDQDPGGTSVFFTLDALADTAKARAAILRIVQKYLKVKS